MKQNEAFDTEDGEQAARAMEGSSRSSRRSALGLGLGAIATALGARWLSGSEEIAEAAPELVTALPMVGAGLGKAKSCIVLWMNGGPSHLDTFDPKPGKDTGGPFKAIKTSAKGVSISEHLPQVAKQANRMAFVRSMTSKEGNHARAQELGRTGHTPNPTVGVPSLGSWISKYKTPKSLALPGFVALGGPSFGGGFFGHEYDPLVVQTPGESPQNLTPFQVLGADRWKARRAELAAADQAFARRTGDRQVASRDAIYDHAVRMMTSTQVKAFDVSSEPDAVKKAYGDTPFGRGCLTARRLIEAGVPFVEVTLDGWDTHKGNFDRVKRLMQTLDPAMATLTAELADRNLLDSTVVLWMGDFGRTPTINGNDGRDHYPGAWSAVIAGGGITPGVSVGATDEEGRKVVDTPVTVPDLLATVSNRLGLDPLTNETSPRGRPIQVTEKGIPVDALMKPA